MGAEHRGPCIVGIRYPDGFHKMTEPHPPPHALTPAQMHELWMKGAALISAVSRASWLLKDDPNGIPADFAEDSYWPA